MASKENRYTYRIEWSSEDKAFIARCAEFPGLGAHGNTQEEALTQARIAVAGMLEWLRDEGKEVPVPLGEKKFRGHISLRIPPEVHRAMAIQAAEQNVSLNQLILSKLK